MESPIWRMFELLFLQELCGADAVDETSELSGASDLARCCLAGEPRVAQKWVDRGSELGFNGA